MKVPLDQNEGTLDNGKKNQNFLGPLLLFFPDLVLGSYGTVLKDPKLLRGGVEKTNLK